MKKTLLFLISIFLLSFVVYAGEIELKDVSETLLTKGKNDVVGQKILKDDIGNTVVVEEIQYALDNVEAELASINTQITNLKNLEWIKNQIAKLNGEKVKLEAVKQKIADSMK